MFKIEGNKIVDVNDKIIDVVIPEGVIEIGSKKRYIEELDRTFELSAFSGCINIETIKISKTVEKIFNDSFGGSLKLKSIEVDKDNKFFTSIDGVLFNKEVTKLIHYPMHKKGKKYEIPNTVTTIGEFSFFGLELQEIVFPDNLTSIESNAFYISENLTVINIGKNVEKMVNPFARCVKVKSINVDENNKIFKSIDGVLYSKNMDALIKYPPDKKDKKFIVEKVKVIEEYAFVKCGNLKEVIVSEGVELIGNNNFVNRGLSKILLPASLKIIEEEFLSTSLSLEEIIVHENNSNYKTVDNVLFSKDMQDLIKYPSSKKSKKYVIPSTVKYIEDDAFEYNKYLEEVIISDGVESIGVRNFSLLINLKEIVLPATLKDIQPHAIDFSEADQEVKIILNEKNKYLKVNNKKLVKNEL